MKKIIYITVAALSFMFSSCNDYLETNSPSKMTDETVYSTLYYAESAVLGVYDRIADAQMYALRISLNWSTNNDIEFVGASETSYNENSNRGTSNYYATPANASLMWTRIYQMIERANLVIKGIENSPLMQGTDQEKKAMKALLTEAKTMRAMGYFEMTRLWGDVPFKVEPTKSDLSNVYLPKVDRDSICDYLITELLEAESDIPWVGESAGSITYASSERISRGFVKGLIARMALTRGGYALRDKPGFPTERGSNYKKYYEIAHKQSKEVINAQKYKLKPKYESIWQDVCALKPDGLNGENLYEVALGLGQSGEIGYSIGVRFYSNAKYGYGNNSNVVNTSAYYYYSFDKDDSRKDATVATVMYSNGNGDLKEVFQGNPLSYNFAKWDQRWMSENTQWLAQNLKANGKWGYGINWICMRYADILLMYAESENELHGATAEAKGALKEVRARAFQADPKKAEKVDAYVDNLNTKDFFEAIVNERAWEFGGEGVRKFDLIRWNLLVDKIQEQRDAIYAMIDGTTPRIFGKDLKIVLPESVYYKYKDDKENIDKESINYYSANKELDDMTDADLKAKGYTKVKWMTAFSDANKIAYKERVKVYSSGLLEENNGVCNNRYLYPIHSSVIGDYQGIITNSYGY